MCVCVRKNDFSSFSNCDRITNSSPNLEFLFFDMLTVIVFLWWSHTWRKKERKKSVHIIPHSYVLLNTWPNEMRFVIKIGNYKKKNLFFQLRKNEERLWRFIFVLFIEEGKCWMELFDWKLNSLIAINVI